MDRFRLEPKDEYNHVPDASPNFNESVYTNAFDPAQRMGGWMRLGNRVNEGYAELSVVLYLPDGRVACQFGRPRITANDKFSGGGLSYEVVEPFAHVRMEYAGEVMVLDDPEALRAPDTMFKNAQRLPARVVWDHRGVSPLHGGEPTRPDQQTMYGRDFSLGHFNQHTAIMGRIEVGDQQWSMSAFGWRDHSWGPRQWQVIHFYRLFIANFGDGSGFMLLKIAGKEGRSRRVGVVMVDGAYEEVIDLDVQTDWNDKQDPQRVRIGVRTARRAAVIEGEIVTMAPLRNRRKIGDEVVTSRIAEGFTRFTWDGRVGYGMTEYIERIENGRLIGYPL